MINKIIATVLSIPLGVIGGYYLAKIIPEEHKVIKKYFKPSLIISITILIATAILTITNKADLITNSISLLLISIIFGIRVQIKSQNKLFSPKLKKSRET